MALPENEILEALSGTRILTAMITPAVLISACGTLIFSTSARLGRIFDRVNAMKGELESLIDGKLSHPEERLEFLKSQIEKQRFRAALIQKSMAALYTATAFFIASSLALAITAAFAPTLSWLPTIIALGGGLFLFIASALLIYESRHNVIFIHRQIDFIEFLQERYSEKKNLQKP